MPSRQTKLSRRQFIARAGQTAALLCGSSALTSCTSSSLFSKKSPAEMRFGLVTYLWGRDWDLPTLIENCEKTDCSGVELRTTHAHGVEFTLTANQRRDVRKRFADTPVTLVGLGSNEQYDWPDSERLAKAIDDSKKFIKLSYDIGTTGVKVKPNAFHKNVPREKTIEQIGRSLNILGRYAADFGQQVRLEVHGSETSQLPVMKAIMDIADHPSVAVCWNCNLRNDLREPGFEYNFNLVKDRFGDTLHIHELQSKRYPYPQLFRMLVEMDYKGWALLEASSDPPDRVAALKEQRELFNRMLADAKKSG